MTDLTAFCGRNGSIDMERVHRRGGIEFATDGKTLAWRRTTEPDTEAVSFMPRALEIVAEVTSRWPADADFLPLPDLGEIAVEGCVECGGTGRELVPCRECDGEGHMTCNLGHRHRCEECGGGACVPGKTCNFCDECEGAGEFEKQTPIILGPIDCDKVLLRKIEPYGVEIVPVAEEFVSVKSSLLLFRIGREIRGLLMPLGP